MTTQIEQTQNEHPDEINPSVSVDALHLAYIDVTRYPPSIPINVENVESKLHELESERSTFSIKVLANYATRLTMCEISDIMLDESYERMKSEVVRMRAEYAHKRRQKMLGHFTHAAGVIFPHTRTS